MDEQLTYKGTDANFNEMVVESDQPVLVDFWAPWCAPCRMVGPILEDVARDYRGKAKVVKINVDEERQVAGQLGIRSIPTIALFHHGQVADMVIGASPREKFQGMLDQAIANG